MSWTRRAVLGSSLAGLLAGVSARGASVGKRRLILVYADGGWDTSYVFDPKPGGATVEGPEVDQDIDNPDDVEALRSFGNLTVQVNPARRPAATQYFERWARRTAVVNGLFVGAIGHPQARARVLTGVVGTGQLGPDLAHIAGAAHAEGLPIGCVDLSGFSSSGSLAPTAIQLGARGQLGALLDDGVQIRPRPDGSPPMLWLPDDDDLAALSAHRLARTEALRVRRGTGHDRSGQRLDDLVVATERSDALRARGEAFTELVVPGIEPSMSNQVDMALALLAGDVCQSVFMDTGLNWDTHVDTASQHTYFETLFKELDRMVGDLQSLSMLDDTLVVVISEMTRTPTRNSKGGKDHWPHTSAMLIGGGTAGGQVLGHTDAWLQALPVDLDSGLPDAGGDKLTYASFAAGVLERLDVDPGDWLAGVRPWRAGCS